MSTQSNYGNVKVNSEFVRANGLNINLGGYTYSLPESSGILSMSLQDVYSKTTTITATYSVASTDYIILSNHSNPIEITLGTPSNDGREIRIKDISATASTHNITIIGTIDGIPDYIIDVDYGALNLVYSLDNSSWFII
jgi:hypothetical protein